MTLAEHAEKVLAHANGLEQSSPQRIRDLAEKCRTKAVELSSGEYSSEELANEPLNHPYGLGSTDYRGRPRGPIPYGDPAVINVQSDDFRSKWEIEEIHNGFILRNTSEHAAALEFPGPESTSIKRPILEAIAAEVIGPHAKEHNNTNFKIEIS